MFAILLISLAVMADDVSFSGLTERKIVQLVTTNGDTLYRAIKHVESNKLTVVDVSSLKEEQFEKSQLKAIRTSTSDKIIAEKVGLGQWVAWQLHPILEGAAKPQTIASIQQAAVYITANRYSGLLIGDKVDVFRLGEPVKDPATGEVLDIPEQKIAKLEVINISDKLVTCRPTGEFVIALQIGDLVRSTEPRNTIAVFPFNNATGQLTNAGLTTSDAVANAMANLGVKTLERTRLIEILGEQFLQLTPLFEGGEASKVGKLLGAATLVTGRIVESKSKKNVINLSVRLLDVRTGEIISSLELESSRQGMDLSGANVNLVSPANSDAPVMAERNRLRTGNKSESTANSIGMKFSLVPAGTFTMGSPASESGRKVGEVSHPATISKDFQLGTFEVTQEQYESVMGSNPSKFKGESNPVEQVNWEEATDFCRRLSALPKEKAANNKYRLPTEAEWEYACRAGTTSACYFGEDASALKDHGWFRDNSSNQTHPVGQKAPNAYGLYDMYGNVYEWCNDWYGDYDTNQAVDPTGPSQGGRVVDKALRGMGWEEQSTTVRSATRGWAPPTTKNSSFGFRVLLEVP